ncbi:hypothetical protein CEXT_561081 [Caerostris extrusa]|uniref:Maturase K n=1 Tax=Caerostris extrusa TaxID=172846 RepID=A0AAV4N8D3_CAEEX|nr:hypothetical protein CEXT_561081 [Caerostris extrusa]
MLFWRRTGKSVLKEWLIHQPAPQLSHFPVFRKPLAAGSCSTISMRLRRQATCIDILHLSEPRGQINYSFSVISRIYSTLLFPGLVRERGRISNNVVLEKNRKKCFERMAHPSTRASIKPFPCFPKAVSCWLLLNAIDEAEGRQATCIDILHLSEPRGQINYSSSVISRIYSTFPRSVRERGRISNNVVLQKNRKKCFERMAHPSPRASLSHFPCFPKAVSCWLLLNAINEAEASSDLYRYFTLSRIYSTFPRSVREQGRISNNVVLRRTGKSVLKEWLIHQPAPQLSHFPVFRKPLAAGSCSTISMRLRRQATCIDILHLSEPRGQINYSLPS